ncbi:hypothetical protein ACMT1E_09155 [Sphingomonas flavalba]|uniref:hypothetical protein n=1 Tax=Sphingomonas flavalba TaxID=2559804 RepID=UPI0039DF7F67
MKKQGAVLIMLLLASCVAPPQTHAVHQPRPAPSAPVSPAPPPTPVPANASSDWRDWPVTPGDWRYAAEGGGVSRYGVAGRATELILRCDRQARAIVLSRAAAGPVSGAMTIQTSSGANAVAVTQAAAGAPAEARLPATSPLLDQMAFSRGRFVVSLAGTARLVVPAWPEVSRVIEDCR